MRRWLLIIAVIFAAVFGLRNIHAQTATPDPCDPESAMSSITDELNFPMTGNKGADLAHLTQAKAIIDAQIAACKAAGVTPAPTDTPIPTDTPTLPEGVTATVTPTLSAAAAQGATRTVIYAARTATASVKQATAAFLTQYKTIDIRELVNYADKHSGEKVIVQGTIFNIVDSTIQIYGNSNFSYPVYIDLADAPSGIYTNDYVTVYGTVDGFYSFQNTAGNTISQARLVDAFVKK